MTTQNFPHLDLTDKGSSENEQVSFRRGLVRIKAWTIREKMTLPFEKTTKSERCTRSASTLSGAKGAANWQNVIAYHEAGHAVIALRLSSPVRSVSIEEKHDCAGRVRVVVPSFRSRRVVENYAMAALAGVVAQRCAYPTSIRRFHG